jgi:hypothetical protein
MGNHSEGRHDEFCIFSKALNPSFIFLQL